MQASKHANQNILCFFTKLILLSGYILVAYNGALAQNTALINGKITDENNKPVEFANISIIGTVVGTTSSKSGDYSILVPANIPVYLGIAYMGYKNIIDTFYLKSGERLVYNVQLKPTSTLLPYISITEQRDYSSTFIRIDAKTVSSIPSISGGVETLIKTLPGVTSNNELSSQYNVRGGNFDENLVYVNDIEIYRPLLVRSGQQEGLSFINSDLIYTLKFSAGGFESKYGDKMSSVLDIRYRKPTQFAGGATASLLGSAAHVEGVGLNSRFTYLMGVRYKTSKYFLNAMQTKGEYKPNFVDYQGFFTYDISEKVELSLLTNIAQNKYIFIPKTRETKFGTFNNAIKLTVFFDGQEFDQYNTYLGAATLNYKISKRLNVKWINSAFQTNERETFDIQGQYWLDQLKTDMGSDDFGNKAFNKGVGTFLNHARNFLDAKVASSEIKGFYSYKKNFAQWGIKYQHEWIDDKLREWNYLDSAGYNIPHISDSLGYTNPYAQAYQYLRVQHFTKSNNQLQSDRINGYIQNTWNFAHDSIDWGITAGIRGNYWSLNHELLVSPRALIYYRPNWKNATTFHFSTGYYFQPPFYKEMRDFGGNVNFNLKAQKSIHFVLGSEYDFIAWHRPFKHTMELYYKILDNLVPYKVDNVRIKYYARNNSRGYAVGFDTKIHGEFVKGADSWLSLGIMQIREDIKDDYYFIYLNQNGDTIRPSTIDRVATDSIKNVPGYIPRPTDQLVSFGIYFQDYFPRNPTYKMHLTLIYGSPLPFGPPNAPKYEDTRRMNPYFRADVGFSKQILGEHLFTKSSRNLIKSLWFSLEVFNLFNASNTISYTWIRDAEGYEYAVPNYLTPRQINARVAVKF